MNQNYTSNILIKYCNSFEKRDYQADGSNLESDLESIFEDVKNNNFTFDFNRVGNYSTVDLLTKKLVLRKLNDNIKRIYQVKQANRRLIIKQIITILQESSPYWILKTDIKKFYESIDRKSLLNKLKEDTILSYHSNLLLNKIDEYLNDCNLPGLPRGLSISSTLSEIYLRKFDRQIKRTTSVFYYARFVDDILIFCTSKKQAEEIQNSLNENLPKGLKANKLKTKIYNSNSILESEPLIYLGYEFWKKEEGDETKLIISIAKKKLKKLKTKIAKSVFNYLKTKDFELLVKRMRFLTGNFSVRNSDKTNDLLAGIYYNYPALNNYIILDDLNVFYRKLISASNGDLGVKMKSDINPFQLVRLKKYSFKSGFTKRIVKRFTKEELVAITSCWR